MIAETIASTEKEIASFGQIGEMTDRVWRCVAFRCLCGRSAGTSEERE
jgi:hypothetical protein